MRTLIQFEFSKIITRKPVVILSVLLLLANLYNIISQYNIYNGEDAAYYNACYDIRQQVEGEITKEKVSEFKKKAAALASGENITDFETLLDSSSAEYNIYSYILSDIERVYRYNDSIVELRNNNAELSGNSNNIYCKRTCKLLEKLYTQRQITSYYETENYERYFEYSLTDFFVLCVITLLLAPAFSDDKEKNIYGLTQSTVNGRTKLCKTRITVSFLTAAAVYTLFSLCKLTVFIYCLRLKGFSNPVYSLSDFADTPFSVSIGIYILFEYICGLFGFLGITVICLIVSSLAQKNYVSFAVCLLAATGLMYLCGLSEGSLNYLNIFNPVSLIAIQEYSKSFSVINIFGFPVLNFVAIICGNVISFIFGIRILMKMNRRNFIKGATKKC